MVLSTNLLCHKAVRYVAPMTWLENAPPSSVPHDLEVIAPSPPLPRLGKLLLLEPWIRRHVMTSGRIPHPATEGCCTGRTVGT